jgi:hypothetical protein
MQTNPEQWALDLLADIIDIGGLGGPCSEADCVECGKVALKIQAAFAEREARLVGALRNLENANDRACGARPQKVYDAMIAAGMTDALIELDDARREARATLAALKDRTHG